MRAHLEDFGHDSAVRPLGAEDFSEALEVLRRGLADGEDVVAEPGHAEAAELLVEEGDAELGGEQRDVLDDRLAHPPLFVLREVHDGREERLREEADPDHVVHLLELADQVQAYLWEVVFEELEEELEEVLDRVGFAEEWGQAGDLPSESGADVLGLVAGEVADAGQETAENGFGWDQSSESWDLAGACCSNFGLVVL